MEQKPEEIELKKILYIGNSVLCSMLKQGLKNSYNVEPYQNSKEIKETDALTIEFYLKQNGKKYSAVLINEIEESALLGIKGSNYSSPVILLSSDKDSKNESVDAVLHYKDYDAIRKTLDELIAKKTL